MACMRPPLDSVPDTEWFCPPCSQHVEQTWTAALATYKPVKNMPEVLRGTVFVLRFTTGWFRGSIQKVFFKKSACTLSLSNFLFFIFWLELLLFIYFVYIYLSCCDGMFCDRYSLCLCTEFDRYISGGTRPFSQTASAAMSHFPLSYTIVTGTALTGHGAC